MVIQIKEKIAIPITGMTCSACVSHVESALRKIKDVYEVDVNLATEKATLTVPARTAGMNSFISAIEDAGYGVGTRKITLSIGGMTSESCVGNLENALMDVKGVKLAKANLASERALIEYVPGVSGISDLRQATETSGYSVEGYFHGKKSGHSLNNELLKKLLSNKENYKLI